MAESILVVDNELKSAVALGAELERYGYGIHVAGSGEQAIEMLGAGAAVDLVLLDNGPGTAPDGAETAERILGLQQVPIIFLASSGESAPAPSSRRIPSYGCFSKGGDIAVLAASIGMALRLHRAYQLINTQNLELLAVNEELQRSREALRASEASTRHKLEALLSPDGDLTQLELGEIIDADSLQELIDIFIMMVPVAMAIIDLRGKVLVAAGWQDLCTVFHRRHPLTRKNCLDSDTSMSRCDPTCQYQEYHCRNNLVDIAIPIVVNQVHVGNLFIGQFLYEDEELDLAVFQEQARQCGFDEKAYLAALDRVPRWNRDALGRVVRFFTGFAKQIASLSYSNLRLARVIEACRQGEAARRDLEQQLRREQRLSAVGSLAGGVAHEINNPLNGIINFAQLIKDRVPEEAGHVREYVDEILVEGERIAVITRSLLAFSRRDSEARSHERPARIVENLLPLCRQVLKKHEVELAIMLEEDLPHVYCVAGQIQQVLLNLVINARDALQERYPGPDPRKLITLRVFPHPDGLGNLVRFAVEDCGMGIPADIAECIFDPFFTTKPAETGTGLGLAISYSIIKDHDGILDFRTRIGEGTCFFFDLPAGHGEHALAT